MRIRLYNQQDKCFVETFAEPVSIEPFGEIFAVHHMLGVGGFLPNRFVVSHTETGCRVEDGYSIEAAIDLARVKMGTKTPEDLARAIYVACKAQAADMPS